MKKEYSFAILVCLISLLMLASCAPVATSSAPAGNQTTTTTVTTPPETSHPETTSTAQTPKYGGAATLYGGATDVYAFEEAKGWYVQATTLKLTNEELWQGDWTKGPAGTGELDWASKSARFDQETGDVAESWDISESGTMTINVRQGIHWALNPDSAASRLVNGRELTADDVVFSLRQILTQPTSYIYRTYPSLRQASVTAPDKWTVVIKVSPEDLWTAVLQLFETTSIVPPEVVEKYGDMTDWRNSVGTGPFMLTDYVPSSSWTMVRNPNYWMEDPIGPGKGNQLPYLDRARFLIIPDVSTREAALRTAKLDQMALVDWEDAAAIEKTAPDVVSVKSFGGGVARPIAMRTDDPSLPFYDIRVREALMMATDFKSLLDTFAGGDGYINTFPIQWSPAYSDAYLPLNEAPTTVQQLYTYDPEKAKDLLTQAGYPNGFNTEILIDDQTADVDYYSAIKAMWAKVGINATIDAKEWGTYYALAQKRNYSQMINATQAPTAQLYAIPWISSLNPSNASYVSDQRVDDARDQIMKLAIAEIPKANAAFKAITPYILSQAWMIPHPEGPLYTFWWPWLRNYHGEGDLGYFNSNLWCKYVWLDEALKASMGH